VFTRVRRTAHARDVLARPPEIQHQVTSAPCPRRLGKAGELGVGLR